MKIFSGYGLRKLYAVTQSWILEKRPCVMPKRYLEMQEPGSREEKSKFS